MRPRFPGSTAYPNLNEFAVLPPPGNASKYPVVVTFFPINGVPVATAVPIFVYEEETLLNSS